MLIHSKELLMISNQYKLTVLLNPISATCTLYYDGVSHNDTTATVSAGKSITYTISDSTYGTETGTITMDSDKTLICNGVYDTTPIYKKRNITEVGSLTKNNAIISNFTTSNYANITSQSGITNIYNVDREEVYKITTGSNVSNRQCIRKFNISGGNGEYLQIYSNKLYYTTRSASAQPTNKTGTYILSANTTYWIKLNSVGNNVTISYSTDGINYAQDITATCTVNNPIAGVGLGVDLYGPRYVFGGSIDLKESYIKIDGSTVWQGIIDGTSSNYDYTEPAYSYYWDKVIT